VRRVKDEADRLGLRTKRSTTANGTREGIELLIPRLRREIREIRKDELSGTLSSDALPR
jgi:hypothetical protein